MLAADGMVPIVASRGLSRLLLAALALVVLLSGPARRAAAEQVPEAPRLHAAFPGATRFGPPEGMPPAFPAWRGEELIGHVISTRHAAAAWQNFELLVGVGRDCRIAGAVLVEHREPILLLGVPEAALEEFVRRHVGLDVTRRIRLGPAATEAQAVQAISRATTSSFALHDAILGTARLLARSRRLACLVGATGTARIDLDSFQRESWPDLLAAGSIVQRRISAAEAAAALRAAGAAEPAAARLPAEANFATNPAQIGANLLGPAEHARLAADAAPGSGMVFLAGDGAYSFKGTAHRRSGVFERVQIVQEDRTIALIAAQHHLIERLRIEGAPELREIALFLLPPVSGFVPDRPWRVELAVTDRAAPEAGAPSAVFRLPYTLPSRHLLPPPDAGGQEVEDATALWRRIWEGQPWRIGILAAALLGLYAVLALQDQVARRRRLWHAIRLGALGFTLLWLGWYAGAQLSVVHVLTFADALRTRFEWEMFLIDPLVFILWSWVAVALLFWGRGVFCGWLCPFGALQELLSRAARALRVPQLAVPFGLHERLWPAKYIAFFVVFAISLGDMDEAVRSAEIEPFKTAIVLRFQRAWPFLLYLAALLAGGLFVERLFCRYLCPLGAAFALPGRMRMFDWLKRRPQCGSECHICAVRCPVQAIHPRGGINPNECIHCLRCQTLYFDEHTCPPLIARRRRRDGRAALHDAGAGAP
jgi:transcriptional regulator of nitric oxide reductase